MIARRADDTGRTIGAAEQQVRLDSRWYDRAESGLGIAATSSFIYGENYKLTGYRWRFNKTNLEKRGVYRRWAIAVTVRMITEVHANNSLRRGNKGERTIPGGSSGQCAPEFTSTLVCCSWSGIPFCNVATNNEKLGFSCRNKQSSECRSIGFS